MQYRKLQADKLFNGHRFVENGVLIINANGRVEDVVQKDEAGEEIEKFSGTLLPGFINCHCHLELSYLKGAVTPKKGLVKFIIEVVQARKKIYDGKEDAIAAAAAEMYKNGISGVADIANTTDALETKLISNIEWYTLVEVLSFLDETAPERLSFFSDVKEKHIKKGLAAVLTPHAPYSVSAATFKAINEATEGAVISIHNQETRAEDELFKTGKGPFLDVFELIGSSTSLMQVSGKSSLQTWLPYFTNGQTILLVHNTCIKEEDIVFAKEHAAIYGLHLVYCLCPNANVYIENTLPPIDCLIKHNCQLVLGTDSYSSNWQLSIAAEIKTLKKEYPHIALETLLSWATSGGAKALGWNHLGLFEKGKKPGVIIMDSDFLVQRLA